MCELGEKRNKQKQHCLSLAIPQAEAVDFFVPRGIHV